MTKARWTVGITHLVAPPFDPEQAAFDDLARFIHFDTRDESLFDPSLLETIDAFLVWTPTITERTAAHLKKCRIVVRYGVGYDKIDLSALGRRGIAFSNNPEYGPEDVADTAAAMLLSLQRRLFEHDTLAKDYVGTWQENVLPGTRHSREATLGVVGLGRIGTSLARRMRPFGYRILAYDPYLSNGVFRALGIERATSLEELAAAADLLSLHCPLTPETRGMIDNAFVDSVKPGLILVNTARGRLVENLDVIERGLRTGQLAAVGLDVLPDEPPEDHPLIDAWRANDQWLRGRLLISPHNAFYSDASIFECRLEAARTARLYLENGEHRNAINAET